MSVSMCVETVPTAIRTPLLRGWQWRRSRRPRTAWWRRRTGRGVVPAGPCGPCGPVAPVSPLRLWKANANVLADAVPPSVTFTEGVPVDESTVAEAPVMVRVRAVVARIALGSLRSRGAGRAGLALRPRLTLGAGLALDSLDALRSAKVGRARARRARDGQHRAAPRARAGGCRRRRQAPSRPAVPCCRCLPSVPAGQCRRYRPSHPGDPAAQSDRSRRYLPCHPSALCGPVAPVKPWIPCGPCSPVSPLGPCGPVAPVSPVSPLSPFGPVKPWMPCGP